MEFTQEEKNILLQALNLQAQMGAKAAKEAQELAKKIIGEEEKEE